VAALMAVLARVCRRPADLDVNLAALRDTGQDDPRATWHRGQR
jgi:hypothetical protein